MNRFAKCAALGLALVLSSTAIFGCQSKAEVSEKLEYVTGISNKALNISEGEILVNEKVTVEKVIEGIAQNKDIETYIVFTNGPEAPDFELQKNETLADTGEYSVYTFVKSGETMIELFDGVGDVAVEAPDIYEALRVDFSADEISKLEVTKAEKLNDCYKMTMVSEYADKYDTETDGVTYDCTSLVICYYIDSVERLTKRTCEITYTLTVNGESQTVTRFIESKIA
ncbi:MAG: hypothetical protein IJY93_07530 [Clostridia bacterium]|nr:hypothetical protein [Clostridia bacterium]